ncbi:MAG TPA: hypothetical protein VMW27_04205 [Thermoanaerobaculia bacterium]|nr:hypothetical protein [Thermoanaerobaculia bacterium]
MRRNSRALLFLVALFLLSTSLVLTWPRTAEAVCCAFKATETFYFDEAKTQFAGRCIDNPCTGSYSCTGTQTEYSTLTIACCQQCSG